MVTWEWSLNQYSIQSVLYNKKNMPLNNYAGEQRGSWAVEVYYRKGWLHWKVTSIFFTFYLAHDSTFHTIDMNCLRQVVIGMNVAASEFYVEKDKTYDL
jgi:hypothetical protein